MNFETQSTLINVNSVFITRIPPINERRKVRMAGCPKIYSVGALELKHHAQSCKSFTFKNPLL